MKKKILVMCPTGRELRALPPIADRLGYELDFDDLTSGSFLKDFGYGKRIDAGLVVDSKVQQYKGQNLSGVVASVGYPGMTTMVALIAERLGLKAPKPSVILQSEHKYYSRLAQKKCVPEATPAFRLFKPGIDSPFDPDITFPFFLKPVKSLLSFGANKVTNREEFKTAIEMARLPEGFLGPFDQLLKEYTDLEEDVEQLLLEDLLVGIQVSLEGYCAGGEVETMAIVEAVMVPGTLSFSRWLYPASIPEEIQQKMKEIAGKYFLYVGYDNAPFNMELMYNPKTGSVHIIEVNLKLANQFCDLVEKVDGYNPFEVLLKIAVGEKPVLKRGEGKYKVAASCVSRKFEDLKVISVPSLSEISLVEEKFPDSIIEILAEPGKLLSEQFQDSDSYRYALANIGADSFEEIESKFDAISSMLDFDMQSTVKEELNQL